MPTITWQRRPEFHRSFPLIVSTHIHVFIYKKDVSSPQLLLARCQQSSCCNSARLNYIQHSGSLQQLTFKMIKNIKRKKLWLVSSIDNNPTLMQCLEVGPVTHYLYLFCTSSFSSLQVNQKPTKEEVIRVQESWYITWKQFRLFIRSKITRSEE